MRLKPGTGPAMLSALLFGAGAPFAKLLLRGADPWLTAGLLYLGSGAGVAIYRLIHKRGISSKPGPGDWPWLIGAILTGGVAGPVLLMLGLAGMPASGASLLLNTEGVFTAVLAWFVFKENFDRRIALGMAAIIAGAVVAGWPGQPRFSNVLPALAVAGACLAWAVDNNLTRRISHLDATWLASVKGFSAGTVNICLAIFIGAGMPAWLSLGGILLVGGVSYGLSLVLFVIALRNLGTARTGAYFSIAPFFGALLALPLLGETPGMLLLIAGGLMALGVWLHLTEHHMHAHVHAGMEHMHEHTHDAHHHHEHEVPCGPGESHTHRHIHDGLSHAHEHFPDIHHRH